MQSCEEFLSELPVGFEELTVDEAVEILSINHAVDATRFFQCSRKQKELTGWIKTNQ